MTDQRMRLFQNLETSILTTSGATSSSLRKALSRYAEGLKNPEAVQGEAIPHEVVPYISKVALHAYRVTDEDIEALSEQGYSEDALFEITLSVALGAAQTCLAHGLAALERGTADASEED